MNDNTENTRKRYPGWKLVSDSGCGLLMPEDIDMEYEKVSFTVSVDEMEYMDENGIDIKDMLEHIEKSSSGGRTSCPSPHAWINAWGDTENVIAFTLSAALSGSYNSAIAARRIALEKHPDRNIFVINTCAAGVMPEYLVRTICEGIDDGDTFEVIGRTVEKMVSDTYTLFALGSLDNLIKAGRISKLVGYAAQHFNISATGEATPGGRIELRHKFRGKKKMYGKLVEGLRENGFTGGELVITHSMNEEGAEKLGHLIKACWLDAEVSVIPAGGLCSYYMGKDGMIVNYYKQGDSV